MAGEYDALDYNLLLELRKNSNLSVRVLAEILGANPNKIIERIKRLERDKVIQKYQAQINYTKLGFNMHAFVSIKLKNIDVKHISILNNITILPDVTAFYWTTGSFDACAIIRARTRDLLSAILSKIGENELVAKTRTDMVFKTYKLHYDFNPLYHEIVPHPISENESEIAEQPYVYDKLDLAIVRELKENAKISYRELSKKLRTHQNTLVHRINRLERNRTIVKYIANIDYYKLGYCIEAILFIRFKGTEVPSSGIVDAITQIPEVKAFYSITGVYDAVALIRVKTIKDLGGVLQTIWKKTGALSHSVTSVILYTYKDFSEYNPLINVPLLDHEM